MNCILHFEITLLLLGLPAPLRGRRPRLSTWPCCGLAHGASLTHVSIPTTRRDSPATIPPIPSTSINFQQVPTPVLRNAKLCPVASKGSYSRFRYFNCRNNVSASKQPVNNPPSNAATRIAEIELDVNVLAAVKLVKVMTSWPTTYLLLKNRKMEACRSEGCQ
jgi:hypothetical protein